MQFAKLRFVVQNTIIFQESVAMKNWHFNRVVLERSHKKPKKFVNKALPKKRKYKTKFSIFPNKY